jgi:lysophospholipase
MLLPGRTEPFAKYCELLDDLRQAGVTVYAMDLRGQGWSDRLTADPQKGHVDKFDDYVADAEIFHDTVVAAAHHAKTVLFGHSTGGAVGTLYLMRHPGEFDAAVLHSPMHQINTAPYWEWVAEAIADSMRLAGMGDHYAPGKSGYDENAVFADNGCEHSHARWTAMRGLMARFPELKIGGPTASWVYESIEATEHIRSGAKAIKTPFLLLQSRQDEVVVTSGQDQVCKAAGGLCSKITFGDPSLSTSACDQSLKNGDAATASRCAGHELLIERDGIRGQVEKAISDYLDLVTGVARLAGAA